MASIYVTVRDSGWAVMREKAGRATKVHDTQKEAIAHARELAKDEDLTVMIQGKDGKFRKG